MKHALDFAAAAVALLMVSACGANPGEKLEGLCGELLAGDPEVIQDMMRDKVSPDAFCSCYAANANAAGDATIDTHTAVFGAIIKIRKDKGVGVGEAAEALEDKLQAGIGDYAFTERAFDAVGDFLDGVQDQIEDGGTCGAV